MIYSTTQHNVQMPTYTDTIIEGPSNVTYLPGVTPLPIELSCNVTGIATWSVNDTSYTISELTNGDQDIIVLEQTYCLIVQ